jgi:hypothetical protein
VTTKTQISSNNHVMSSRSSLTPQFHHDRGRVVIADSPRRGEYGALWRSCGRQIAAMTEHDVKTAFRRSGVNRTTKTAQRQ